MTTTTRAKLTARYAELKAACERLRDELLRNDPDTRDVALGQFIQANGERLALGERLDLAECMATL